MSWRPYSYPEIEGFIVRAEQGPARPSIAGIFPETALVSVTGEAGIGKTRFGASIVADEIMCGYRAGWWDTEQGPARCIRQLLEHGASEAAIAANLVLVSSPAGLPSVEQLKALTTGVRLILLDGITGALTALGLNSNSDVEVEKYYAFLRRVVAMGPTIAAVDHPIKNKAEQGRYAAGSQRKLAAVDIGLRLDVKHALRPGHGGSLKITITKDRDGILGPREWVLASDMAFRIESTELDAGQVFKPTFQMQRVSEYLEAQDTAVVKNSIEQNVKGENDKVKRDAIAHLIADGYVAVEKGKHGALLHSSIKPYRDVGQASSASSAKLVYSSANRGAATTSASSVTRKGNELPAEVGAERDDIADLLAFDPGSHVDIDDWLHGLSEPDLSEQAPAHLNGASA